MNYEKAVYHDIIGMLLYKQFLKNRDPILYDNLSLKMREMRTPPRYNCPVQIRQKTAVTKEPTL